MLTLEDMSLEEIEAFRTHYEKLAMTAREKLRRGQDDNGIPAITIGTRLLSWVDADSLPGLCDHHGS